MATCSVGSVDLGEWLVRRGLALDWPQYSKGKFDAIQREAEQAGRGMWAGSYVEPWLYRVCIRAGGRPAECSDDANAHPAPVVRNAGADRELIRMRWGMPPPPKFGGPPVTNIRNTASPHWRDWLKPENSCLVPFNSFAYPRKRPPTEATQMQSHFRGSVKRMRIWPAAARASIQRGVFAPIRI